MLPILLTEVKTSGVHVVSLLLAIMTDGALVCLVLVGNASVWTGVIFGLRAKVVACPRTARLDTRSNQ